MLFLRTMGGALGVGLLGASLGFDLSRILHKVGGESIDKAMALQPDMHHHLSAGQLSMVQSALGGSLAHVFVEMFILLLLTFLCVRELPSGRPQGHAPAVDGEAENQDDGDELAMAQVH
jgi:hypothetical protein